MDEEIIEKQETKEIIKKKAEELTYEPNFETPVNFLRLTRLLKKSINLAIKTKKRIMIVLSGEDQEKIGILTSKLILFYENVLREEQILKNINFLYVFYDSSDASKLKKEIAKKLIKERGGKSKLSIYRIEDSRKLLGQTFQGAVIDLLEDLRPNYIGIISGLIEKGGLLILQTPSWDKWDNKVTLFKRNLIVPNYDKPRNIFITWFKKKIIDHKENMFVYDADNDKLINQPEFSYEMPKEVKIEIPNDIIFPKEIYELALTQDQVNVIKESESLKDFSEKKKVIVVTANRGRGKSCAIGLSISGLAKKLSEDKKRVKIVVTSPSLENTQSLMELAIKGFEKQNMKIKVDRNKDGLIYGIYGENFAVSYLEPKDAIEEPCDILAIDEASGLPVTILVKLWQYHKKILIASTLHGYEGAGRGFSFRFLNYLKKDENTSLKLLEMITPIRYAENDPIEKWLFDVLLLDAEPADIDDNDLSDINNGNLSYLIVKPEDLFFKDEGLLRQIFGIYVQAHYRNEPDDLALIADAPHYIIRAIKTSKGKVVSASLIAEEGGLSYEFSKSLLLEDRTRGNIIPDRIIKHYRIVDFGTLKGWRIVRIATHPILQNKGLGSKLLSYIVNEGLEKKLDWIGSGFGINLELANFWLKNGFPIIHMSPDRNPISGEYTVLVLKPLSEKAKKIQNVIINVFKNKLVYSLYDTYKIMEPDLAVTLLNSIPIEYKTVDLSEMEKQRLWAYLYGTMTYETTNDVIFKIVNSYFKSLPINNDLLNDIEKKALILKVMQGRSWKEVSKEMRISLDKAEKIVKMGISKLSYHYYNIDENYKTGIDSSEL
ncbi:putative P-loop ATPase fused to an acetyltransferase [Caldisphaera lagunensis DSM 15908]|uniref:tRNA(Met) cytidine acetyltransferase TmcA n=1 Tax=Caldisphaera lagunensis (strain DSM 15908 / JCM 11604 / ANMR 0165 / IC-154) TaxID=1056495 RepID=L0ABG9_CALLD|nr:tRNA(Met) cytidine acetyltransferase TmcA [Caldisphaera lagunensis]AFZ71243.1 putative P-loop ATPase fused to an acetyltransferase [Caldisphaera lagunensis DSM 15908]